MSACASRPSLRSLQALLLRFDHHNVYLMCSCFPPLHHRCPHFVPTSFTASSSFPSNVLLHCRRQLLHNIFLSTNPSTRRQTAHIHYLSDMHFSNKTSVPIEIRVFSNAANPIITDATVVYVIAKAAAVPLSPPNKDNVCFYLEAMLISPHPGNPSDDNYDDITPDNIVPWCWAIGPVTTQTVLLADNKSFGFDLSVSDYVRDAIASSTVRCRFEGSNARWARGPPKPIVSSIIQVAGPLAGMFSPGHVELSIEHIVLSLGTVTDASPANASPAKKRKYAATSAVNVAPANPTAMEPASLTPSTSTSAVEAAAQGLTPPASTSAALPMAAVDAAAAVAEVNLGPATVDNIPPRVSVPTDPPKTSKYKGKGRASKPT